MPEPRVPPATALAFEKLAMRVCNEAKLDYDEWPARCHELVGHLQARWREGIEQELSTEAAEERAMELFGDVSRVARSLRQPWIRRLLFHRRYRAERYILFLAASVLGSWLWNIEQVSHASPKPDDDMMSVGLAAFFNGFVAIGSLALVLWKPKSNRRWIRVILSLRYVMVLFMLIGLYNSTIFPVLLFRDYLGTPALGWGYSVYFGIHCAHVMISWLGTACFISEWWRWPEKSKRPGPA